MKNNTALILLFIIFITITFIVAGFIGAVIHLVNLPTLFLAIILILGISYLNGWNWWKLFIQKVILNKELLENKKINLNRKEAARKSLDSIDRLILKIQDDIAKKALKEEKEKIENELLRGDLVVVLFGTGSSGKTSLIRALLNEIVGETGAPMGLTKNSQTYRMYIKGLPRGIKLIDTPGILESGATGRLREKQALMNASKADLVTVIIDNALRDIELELISNLSSYGKRILLVLNKCDLRGENEVYQLTKILEKQTNSFINRQDIISISASPQSIPRIGYKPYQPKPEISKLVNRIANILYLEGDELLADNILMQCQDLDQSGRKLLNNQREILANKCIEKYSWISSGVVLINPLPGIDLLGVAAINTQMILEMSKIYGIEITRYKAQSLAISIGKTIGGLGLVKSGMRYITPLLSLSAPSIMISQVIQGITTAWLIKIGGDSLKTYFYRDQDWGDGGIQEVIQHHYNLNAREKNLKIFMKKALQRVVEPLRSDKKKELPQRPMPRQEGGVNPYHENQEEQ